MPRQSPKTRWRSQLEAIAAAVDAASLLLELLLLLQWAPGSGPGPATRCPGSFKGALPALKFHPPAFNLVQSSRTATDEGWRDRGTLAQPSPGVIRLWEVLLPPAAPREG